LQTRRHALRMQIPNADAGAGSQMADKGFVPLSDYNVSNPLSILNKKRPGQEPRSSNQIR